MEYFRKVETMLFITWVLDNPIWSRDVHSQRCGLQRYQGLTSQQSAKHEYPISIG